MGRCGSAGALRTNYNFARMLRRRVCGGLLPRGLLSFRAHPFGFIFPMLAIAGFLSVKLFLRAEREGLAFGASAAYIVGMLTSVTFTLYPNVLPATTGLGNNLTVANAKAADY